MLNGFISYCHKDQKRCAQLREHLKPIERRGDIKFWSDHHIRPGAPLKEEVLERVEQTHFALLLVSTSFIISDFISDTELPAILRRWEDGALHMVPVVLSHFTWEHLDERLRSVLMAPPDARPITSYNPHSKGYVAAIDEIDRSLKDVLASRKP